MKNNIIILVFINVHLSSHRSNITLLLFTLVFDQSQKIKRSIREYCPLAIMLTYNTLIFDMFRWYTNRLILRHYV